MNNSRVLLILIFIVLCFGALVYRLVNLQIIRSDELSYFAKRQQTNSQIVKAERGFIYDRNDVLLVYNRNDYSYFVDLRMLPKSEKTRLAGIFSKTIGKSKRHYLNLLNASGKTICLEKKVPFEKSLELFEYKNPAFFYVEEPVSVFHYGSLGSHVLGYVDNEYKGINGISKSFDDVLRGKDGYRMVERNAMGEIISISETQTRPSVPGDDIYLTIDKRYQTIVEDELRNSLKQNGGESATCIIMDPQTGEILAMANISDYDPNYFWKYDDFARKNRAITDSYEPGSTFKAITFAALLEDKVVNENERINTENGVYKFKNNYIRDSHKYESLTVREILQESSNIGTAKLIQRMSDEEYYQYVRSFGFGTFTSITLPGEVTGKLVDLSRWSNQTKIYMSFGYSISVTPLQLTNAFCAIVNGGILYQPQIVKREVDKNGGIIKENSPVMVRRVISEKTSEKMRSILYGAVEKGTGKQARIESIPVGGKTGTSKLVVNGKYSDSQYYSSFVGFYPVEQPTIVCYVLITKPKGDYYGGLVSAPVFKNIISRIHSLDKGNTIPSTPDTEIKTTERLNQKTEKEYAPLDFQSSNELKESQSVFISTNNLKVMPDLKGKTIKEAVLKLNERGIKWTLSGTGVVVEQSIPPGQTIDKRKTCVLTCSETRSTGMRIY
ncbi:MAG: transpeptidase family protein [Ignavibacteriaceae bacterium]|nr:transpeptidase family protein [Ignavibacteriaceae bacterium]